MFKKLYFNFALQHFHVIFFFYQGMLIIVNLEHRRHISSVLTSVSFKSVSCPLNVELVAFHDSRIPVLAGIVNFGQSSSIIRWPELGWDVFVQLFHVSSMEVHLKIEEQKLS